MNISDKYRCIFIHIPKTAGTSIKELLGMPGSGHPPWQFFYNNFPDKWHSYVKFTVVRNPWERTVSSYTYARMERSYWHDSRTAPHPDYELLKSASFREFCDILLHKRELLKHESWHPQHFWIAGKSNNETVLMVPNILRCETLERDFSGLCRKLGISPVSLPRINVSDHRDYRNYYDDRTRDIIGRVYADEIRLLGYSF
jgi:hypothetical protein